MPAFGRQDAHGTGAPAVRAIDDLLYGGRGDGASSGHLGDAGAQDHCVNARQQIMIACAGGIQKW